MSFANIVSLISSYSPTSIGVFGYLWTIVGNFFNFIFIWVMNGFYNICRWLLAFVDFLQYFIQKLIGLDYWLSPGQKSIQGATDSDLLFSFLYNETVQDVFRALIGLFIIFLIIFTIFAIVKEEWKFATGNDMGSGSNSKNKIIGSSLKAIALVVIIPLIVIIGVVSSNAILASIVKALNIDTSTTFGNTLFSISSISANKYRIYTDRQSRNPVSTDVTFYVSGGKVIKFGEDGINSYENYLNAINGAKKYTVDSMFNVVNPSKSKEFYGYCIALDTDSGKQYYMVEVDINNKTSNVSKDKINGMYYYLKDILKVDIMSKGDDISNPKIYAAVKKNINSDKDTYPCLIENFNIDECFEDEVYDACRRTWSYASLYQQGYTFDTTLSSQLETDLNNYKLTGVSNARIFYNSNDYGTYFDGGQFGAVSLNAEYGVMTDVIDFICETGANLYVLDITSSLINWEYEEYKIKSSLISESREYYNGEYLPFVVDYSETAMDNEEGKTLYFAKKNVSSELEGAKYIMCWKVTTEGQEKFIPLINRKTFVDPASGQTFTFKSEYLTNDYNGVILAKGNFDDSISSSVNLPSNGDPTYLKMGSELSDGKNLVNYQNKAYYYDIKEDKILTQKASRVSATQSTVTLSSLMFDYTNYSGYVLRLDNNDKFYKLYDALNVQVDINEDMISKITINLNLNGNSYNLTYANIKNGDNYLFVSESTGYSLVVKVVSKDKLGVYGISSDGSIVAENKGNGDFIETTSFKYEIEVKYDNNSVLQTSVIPLNLSYAGSDNLGNSLFSTNEKYYINANNIQQNMTISVYLNGSSLYNLESNRLVLASISSKTYDLQMYNLNLYNYMTGAVGGSLKEYDSSDIKDVLSPLEVYSFGLFTDDFSWDSDVTDYYIYNGSSYIAKISKNKGEVIGGANDILSKSTMIDIDGEKYYNIQNSNKYSDEDAMKIKYNTISNSLYVGCYRDQMDPAFLTLDLHLAFVVNWRSYLRLCYPSIEKEVLMNENYGVFSLSEGIAFNYFFEGSSSLLQFYNAYKISYWIILIASAIIIKALGTALWGVIKRFYEITLYYLAMPVAASLTPLDNGAKFGSIQKSMIQNVLGAYGVILGINMFFVLITPIKSISNIFTQAELDSSSSFFLRNFPFGAKILNNYVYILFILVAFTMISTLPGVINGLVGGKDVVAEGKTTKSNVGSEIKDAGDLLSGKKAMDFGKKTIDTLGNTPLGKITKWGVDKVKNKTDKVQGYINAGIAEATGDGSSTSSSSRAEEMEPTETPVSAENTATGTTTGGGSSYSESTSDSSADTSTDSSTGETGTASSSRTDEQEVENAAKEKFNAATASTQSQVANAARATAENSDKQSKDAASAIANGIIKNNQSLINDGINKANSGMTAAEIIELIRQLLGEEAQNLTDDEIRNNYAVTFVKDDLTGKRIARISDGKNITDLNEDQQNMVDKAIISHAKDTNIANAYKGLSGSEKSVVDKNGSLEFSFGTMGYNKHRSSAIVFKETVNGSSTNALKLMDKYKGDENIENEVILKKLENDGKLDKFFKESGLSKNSSKEDILSTIALMKNSQNSNAASVAYGKTKGKMTDELARVMAEKVRNGEIKATAWDLATETERQTAIAEQKKNNHMFTAEEQEVAKKLGMQNVRNLENGTQAEQEEFYDKVVESYLNNSSIENKEIVSRQLLAVAKIDIGSAQYKTDAAKIKKAKDSSGKAIDMKEIAKMGYSSEDVMLAYNKMQLLKDKNGQVYGKNVNNKDGSLNLDAFMEMLKHGNEGNEEALKQAGINKNDKKKIATALLETNGKTAILTSDEQDDIISKIADSDKSRFEDYDAVVSETKLRKQVDDIYAAQGGNINSAMLDNAKGSNEYNAVLNLINDMKTKLGQGKVSSITDDDLTDLINNEDNLGYAPEELENLKKKLIRDELKNTNLSNVTNMDNLSETDKNNFEYKKEIIKDQIKSEGEVSKTLINLYKNSEFIGKDAIEQLVNNLKVDPSHSGMTNDQLLAEALKDKDNIKDILLNIGATDMTKAISKNNLKSKQLDIIRGDEVLKKQLKDAGVKIANNADILKYIASKKNASFNARLDEKIAGMIDPSKQVSDEDKARFFSSRTQDDMSNEKMSPIKLGLAKNQKVKKIPKEWQTNYDSWNDIIQKDIDAVKSDKGVYASMSKEERKAKLDELKSNLIDNSRPADYYNWDNDKQNEYDEQQDLLKNQALNTKFSKLAKNHKKVAAVRDRNALLNIAHGFEDKVSKLPVLGSVTARFASDELKRKYEKDLLAADEQISRFNSTAAMRSRGRDFGVGFDDFAKTYFDEKTVNNIKKDLKKQGISDTQNDAAAQKAREEAIAKQLNKNYSIAKSKFAKVNRVDSTEFGEDQGANVGGVRYKDGTEKYTQIKSRLGFVPSQIVKHYDNKNGKVSKLTKFAYDKLYGNKTQEAAIAYQNQQKLYDQIVEFNKTYKKSMGDYSQAFEDKFGKDIYQKYYLKGFGNKKSSPAIVQEKEILKRLENDITKNLARQSSSGYIPADNDARNKFVAQTLTNAKTRTSIEHDKLMRNAFKDRMKEFNAQTNNGADFSKFDPNKFLQNINPAVLGKHLEDFKALDEKWIRNYLETNYNKYNKRVINNTFTPNQKDQLVKLNGIYVDKSKVSRMSNAAIKSLNAADQQVYKNLIKSLNSATAKVNNETQTQNQLQQTLKNLQSGIQSRDVKKEIEKVKRAIANSQIRLNNLKAVQLSEAERKKAFEQAIASEKIKQAIRDNAANAANVGSGAAKSYTRLNGSARNVVAGSVDQRQIQALEKRFMAQAKSELDYMLKTMGSKQSEAFKNEIKKVANRLSYDTKENLKQIRNLQTKLKKEINALASKTDSRSKQDKLDLQTQNQKLDDMIKRIVKEFEKMDILV